MSSFNKIKIPYSRFGSKRTVVHIIWKALGNIENFIDPFFGSLSVLLGNPFPAKIETVNEIDPFLVNFWRGISQDPDGVAKYADYPVSEIDLHARQRYLLNAVNDEFKYKLEHDPDFYDVKISGYWIWGQSCSIGNNWLLPKGINALPLLSSAGGGVHGLKYNIKEEFKILQERLRRVRIICGDWKKCVASSITFNSVGIGPKDITGILLDSPYSLKNRDKVYKEDKDIYNDVCLWAIENGDNPRLRIALCGYDGDHIFPESWQTYKWSANGGMSGLGNGRGKENAKRECIYFSPYCLKV